MPDTVSLIKGGEMNGSCSMHGREDAYKILESLKRREQLENLGTYRGIIEWILKNRMGRCECGFISVRIETGGRL
jgi:hypothetical protein